MNILNYRNKNETKFNDENDMLITHIYILLFNFFFLVRDIGIGRGEE